jgi:hypothetical protein
VSSREIRARIERLTKVLGEQQPNVPVCRFHAKACRMGANWPLPWPGLEADAELIDMVRAAHIKVGKEVGPHPRDVWQTDAHEVVPQAELDEQERELQALLATVRARNDQLEAELRGERVAVTKEEWHG